MTNHELLPVKRGRGRPPAYDQWLTEDGLTSITDWAAKGLSIAQIAKNMGIHHSTFFEWQNKFPDLLDAVKKGKRVVDMEVENSLFRKAMGYEYEEEEWRQNDNGEMYLAKKHIKSQAPDTTAQIFWLKNRMPEEWRDRKEVANEHSGTIKIELGEMEKWSK